jgi:hypothetical protein
VLDGIHEDTATMLHLSHHTANNMSYNHDIRVLHALAPTPSAPGYIHVAIHALASMPSAPGYEMHTKSLTTMPLEATVPDRRMPADHCRIDWPSQQQKRIAAVRNGTTAEHTRQSCSAADTLMLQLILQKQPQQFRLKC